MGLQMAFAIAFFARACYKVRLLLPWDLNLSQGFRVCALNCIVEPALVHVRGLQAKFWLSFITHG